MEGQICIGMAGAGRATELHMNALMRFSEFPVRYKRIAARRQGQVNDMKERYGFETASLDFDDLLKDDEIETISEAIEMIEYADAKGYETTCNLMSISRCTMEQVTEALEQLSQTPAMGVYIVDSYGALYPKEVRKLTRLYSDKLGPVGKLVGIHAHNNQQCAFANTVEAKNMGAKLLDATAYGIGRGAGNCHMEALLGYLNGKKYHVEPILDLVRYSMLPLKEQGVEWGYNTAYLITGLTNQHPRDAIGATKVGNRDFREQFRYHSYE